MIGERLWALCNKADQKSGSTGAAAGMQPVTAPGPARSVPAARPAAAMPAPSRDAIQRNWPNLRGPFGQGIAYHATPPTSFDGTTGKNVLWKAAVPKPGASSPVVWEGRVFLTGADSSAREVYCFDAANGQLLWRHTAKQPASLP